MLFDKKIFLAQSDSNIFLDPAMANRHGIIAGATGTGKTVTMKVLAEGFSDMGVPVFLADVKGDVSGMCEAGNYAKIADRVNAFGLTDFACKAYPVRFWDIFGEVGHPARVTVSDMGPVLLSRLLGLSEAQSGVLSIVFRAADDQGLLLLDLKDLRSMVAYVGENRAEYTNEYGNVSSASIGAIQRALLALEDEGGNELFGEPALDLRDWMRTDLDGRGYINILSSARLIQSPTVYATFLLWMLTDLYEKLPEVGDLPKPRMVFFFDEAHLLFDGASKALKQKITQVIRLIRSKGVGIFFVTQSTSDIPAEVLDQLNNRIQHGLNAYTPAEQKDIRMAAKAFRANPAFDTAETLQALGTGEALISLLQSDGSPSVVQRARILPPQSSMDKAAESTVSRLITVDEMDMKYRTPVDRESAYELLEKARTELALRIQEEAEAAAAEKLRLKEEAAAQKAAEKQALAEQKAAEKQALAEQKAAEKQALAEQKAAEKAELAKQKASAKKTSAVKKTAEKAATSAASSVARSLSTNLVNTVAGGKKASSGTIAKRAATNALSSVMRSGVTSIIRGLFGNKK